MDKTLEYYAQNAEKFASDTAAVDFTATQNRFLSKLAPGATILDFGCGSGRDTKAFLDRGYNVTAVDGSPELCVIASVYTGIPVWQMLFQKLNEHEVYDGIWACASILHVQTIELSDVFHRMITSLKPGGIIYTRSNTEPLWANEMAAGFAILRKEPLKNSCANFPNYRSTINGFPQMSVPAVDQNNG